MRCSALLSAVAASTVLILASCGDPIQPGSAPREVPMVDSEAAGPIETTAAPARVAPPDDTKLPTIFRFDQLPRVDLSTNTGRWAAGDLWISSDGNQVCMGGPVASGCTLDGTGTFTIFTYGGFMAPVGEPAPETQNVVVFTSSSFVQMSLSSDVLV